MRRVTILIMLTTVLAVAPAGAAEGKIPVWMPTVITQPGHYVLTRNISASTGPVISIQTDGVTLDLNGHTIGLTSTTAAAIQIGGAVGSSKGIIITGGKVGGGLHGIDYHPPDPLTPLSLSDLMISGSAGAAVKGVGFGQISAQGIIVVDTKVGFELLESAGGSPPPAIPPRAMIRNADIRAGGGIHCTGVVCSIRDSAFEYQPPDPMAVTPAIRFSGIDGGEAVGIIVVDTMPAGGIVPCVLEVLSSKGIIIIGSKVGRPGLGGGGDCVEVDALSSGVVIQDNVLTGCGGDGIHAMGSDITMKGNVINGSGGHGIFAGGSNFIIDDDMHAANTGAGIWFQTGGHVYRGNILRGNTGGAVGGPGATGVVDGGGNIP